MLMSMKSIVIATDTWSPNVNGVVTSLLYTKKILEARNFRVRIVHPGEFMSLPLPSYSEIRLSWAWKQQLDEIVRQERPDYIHIATEGSLGLAVRQMCIQNRYHFTTAYHTKLPEYVSMRLGGFGGVTQRYLKWFHNAGDGAMVSTDSLKRELVGEGFERVVVTPLGVDVDLFSKNNNSNALPDLARPIFVFLGRVAIEKNIRAFLDARVPGTKVVIGDGPDKEKLEEEFRGKAIFTGYKTGQELIDILSVARVMVFPSRTDTLGLVILEALACSLPVAAFDVGGPKDIITNGLDGYAGNNIEESIKNCLNLRPEDCRAKALGFSWERSVDLFIENLVPLRG